MTPNKAFQRTVKKLRILPSAEFARWASLSTYQGNHGYKFAIR